MPPVTRRDLTSVSGYLGERRTFGPTGGRCARVSRRSQHYRGAAIAVPLGVSQRGMKSRAEIEYRFILA